jgi:hypothetical protein
MMSSLKELCNVGYYYIGFIIKEINMLLINIIYIYLDGNVKLSAITRHIPLFTTLVSTCHV